MIIKRLLCPERVRQVPAHFSWGDHRLIRDRHIEGCSPQALALYLLLVTVGDAEGLSYYSDRSVAGLLSIEEAVVRKARQELVEAGLIAYRKPLYQVLSLERASSHAAAVPRTNRCASIGEILRAATGDAR